MRHRPVRTLAAALFACLALLVGAAATGCSGGGGSGTGTGEPSAAASAASPRWAGGLPTVPVGRLPAEARQTLRLIDAGGPFPYDKDGTVFGNFERVLPKQKRGYYREYTVRTPGSRDRGARRLVTGSGGEIYYTDDHYDSFKAVLR